MPNQALAAISWRIIIDPPHAGALNMAVDEALLNDAAGGGPATVRFYEWSAPTLSLGYFQSHAERRSHAASQNCPVVRRATGGGAIVHDRELTYSATLSDDSRRRGEAPALYRLMHETLAAALSNWNIEASLCGPSRPAPIGGEAFLCFQRRSPGDLLIGDVKIAGSAQRRRQGAILQHGSVLLDRSASAPELPGINDLAGTVVASQELVAAWSEALGGRPSASPSSEPLPARVLAAARDIERKQFGSAGWTNRR